MLPEQGLRTTGLEEAHGPRELKKLSWNTLSTNLFDIRDYRFCSDLRPHCKSHPKGFVHQDYGMVVLLVTCLGMTELILMAFDHFILILIALACP